eukprot:305615_1
MRIWRQEIRKQMVKEIMHRKQVQSNVVINTHLKNENTDFMKTPLGMDDDSDSSSNEKIIVDAVNKTHGNNEPRDQDIVIHPSIPHDEVDMAYTNEGSEVRSDSCDSDSLDNIYVKEDIPQMPIATEAITKDVQTRDESEKKEEDKVTKGDAYYDEYLQRIHEKSKKYGYMVIQQCQSSIFLD